MVERRTPELRIVESPSASLEQLSYPPRDQTLVWAALLEQSALDLTAQLEYVGAGAELPAFQFQVGIPRTEVEVGRIDIGVNLPLLGDTPDSSDWERLFGGEISVVQVGASLGLRIVEGEVALSPVVVDAAREIFIKNAAELELSLSA